MPAHRNAGSKFSMTTKVTELLANALSEVKRGTCHRNSERIVLCIPTRHSTLGETSSTFFTREAMSFECLGWSRSRTGRFVDSIDKRLLTGTGCALRSIENGELCTANPSTVWTHVLNKKQLHG